MRIRVRVFCALSGLVALFGVTLSACSAGAEPADGDSKPIELPDIQADVRRFSGDLNALAGDWVSSEWRHGALILHPEIFNEYADDHRLRVFAPEVPAGRTAQEILTEFFDPWTLGDADAEFDITMAGAEIISGGILMRRETWQSYFGGKVSMFGVAPLPDGTLLPFEATCTYKSNPAYDGDTCTARIARILTALTTNKLKLATPPAPVQSPGWSGHMMPDGT